jgi:predicted nucleic acid-binding protein
VPFVSNSSPLIALLRIQRLDLVPAILESVLIPPAVAREIRPSIPDLPDWLRVRALSGAPSLLGSRGRLGDGEWEAIALASEVGAAAILIDDRPARRLAEMAGLSVIGTLGLLLEAKKVGLIRTIRPELDKLLETSFFLGEQLYDLCCIHLGRARSALDNLVAPSADTNDGGLRWGRRPGAIRGGRVDLCALSAGCAHYR